MLVFLAIVLAYLLGAIPSAYIIGKRLRGIDIRKHRSGNVGTTNAFRVLGKGPGIVVLIADILKGFIAAKICLIIGQASTDIDATTLGLIGAIIAMAGHSWSVFLQFKGGKGVATGAGALLALMPKVTLTAALIFIVVIYISRYVSLGSILAAFSVPILTFVFAEPLPFKIIGVLAATVIIVRHTSNIKRLLNGTENKIGRKI